ncbi:hypothetical protein VTK73DRAFT_5852 [Phialemonium thermophilum]|uniref:Uncharacterized protein n=1 Tax=Phialemonium thermophilum TaxID=223376 RepID=A0ABR3V0D6_9PEZI
MNTLGAPTLAEDSPEDVYDPDEVVPRNSPILSAHVPKLQPSPSRSPSVELREASPASSARSRKLSSRFKIKPSQGDAALVALLGGGSRPEIAIHAGREVLVHDTEDEDLGCSSSSAYSERSRSRTRSISPFRDASHQEEEEERWRRTNGGAGGGRDGSSSHSHSHSNSNSRRGSDHEAAACRAQGESSSSMTTTDSSRRPEAAGALDLKRSPPW